MKNLIVIAALVALSACSSHGRGNADFDYRVTSFSTVNHCTHNTRFC